MKRLLCRLSMGSVLVLTIAIIAGSTQAAYLPPVGGWDYCYDGSAAADGTGYTALDGTWSHDNGSDNWDGSVIGTTTTPAPAPGGVSLITQGDLDYIRIQETGEPRRHGFDPDRNRKILFGHSITNDGIDASETVLADGITISFRARVATGAPLDPMYPSTGGDAEDKGTAAGTPWPQEGDGYLGHDDGKGNFSVRQSGDDDIVSFSLALGTETMKYDPTIAFSNADNVGGQAGLVMNTLRDEDGEGNPVGDVDPWEHRKGQGTLNLVPLDPTQWHEFWITIQADSSTPRGTHLVRVWKDDSLVSNDFIVTAGGGDDYGDSYIAMGVGATGQMGAIDVDFFCYKAGAVEAPEPTTLVLLALGGLGAILRRKR